jgi:excisionase family DNA binding protein
MSVSQSEIEQLEKWLKPRLGALISQSEKVRDVLQAAGGVGGVGGAGAADAILQSAMQVVADQGQGEPCLSPQQAAVWKTLLPILSEHGLMAVKTDGPAADEDRPLSKEEAAEFLGFSVRKLERCMQKRQIEYEKYGVGKTATVRFRRSELEKYREKRKVPAKGHRP